ncbi:MAG: PEP-CTERM sorting domain-containing protein, partial [Opitutales bacterium]|nr:PEP-CTERM sorting domain-containing protein [Opitutales bacterium]
IKDNSYLSTYNIQGGLFSLGGSGSSLTIDNATISDNASVVTGNKGAYSSASYLGYGAMGGVVCAMNNNTINISNTTFNANSAESAGLWSGGGVAYLKNATATFTDTLFTNNYVKTIQDWDGGGAIYSYGTSNLTFKHTQDATYVGNYVENDGIKSDVMGGFVRLDDSSVANFNISENATLTIGDGTAGYDSVAGSVSSTINKIGSGALVVNGSMKYFTGALNVNAGSMDINNGLGAIKTTVKKGASLNVDGFVANDKSVTNTSDKGMTGGFILAEGSVNLTNASVTNNNVTEDVYTKPLGGGFADIRSGGEMTVKDSTFSNNNVVATTQSQVQGTLFHVFSLGKLNIENSTFENNKGSSLYNTQGGVVSLDGNVSLDVKGSTFKGNVVEVLGTKGVWGAMGGVICAPTANGSVSINVKDTTFDGNAAISLEKMGAGGGVAYLKNTQTTFTDAKFTNNYVKTTGNYDGGGVIYSYGNADLTFNVTKSENYVGNYVENDGVKTDSLGGFAYFDQSTIAKFNISENATLTIGDGTAGYDSVVGSANSTINKLGTGALIINGSMEYFTGVLDVQEGSMTVNSVLGASDIIVAGGAVLALGENADIILHGCSITVEEGGSLELGANTSITVNLEQDFAGSTNLFTIADGANLTQNGETVTLAELEENMTVTYNGEVLDNSQWSFDSITGKLTASVPEPSTYAAIFGALALAFAAYRRRK